jgi:hypothetical protein
MITLACASGVFVGGGGMGFALTQIWELWEPNCCKFQGECNFLKILVLGTVWCTKKLDEKCLKLKIEVDDKKLFRKISKSFRTIKEGKAVLNTHTK